MKKNAIQPLPKYFDRYINLVDDVDLDEAMERSLAELAHFDRAAYRQLGLQTYAPEKWTVPDVLQHLIDWERIMTYRALIFARQISKAAPGHDENLMAVHAEAFAHEVADIRLVVDDDDLGHGILRSTTYSPIPRNSGRTAQPKQLRWKPALVSISIR